MLNYNYLIISIEDVDRINFSEIPNYTIESAVKSLDKSKILIGYDANGEEPSFVQDLLKDYTLLNHAQALEIVEGPEWKPDMSQYEF